MPTEEQIEVGCDVAKEKLREKAGTFASYVSDDDIKEVVTAVLVAAENTLGAAP